MAPKHRTVVVVFFVVFVIAVGAIASMEIACPLLSLDVSCLVLVTIKLSLISVVVCLFVCLFLCLFLFCLVCFVCLFVRSFVRS